MRLEVLYEDNHLLIVNKPAGLATMGVVAGQPSLWQQARSYLKRKYHKPGNVYLGVVSRLDRPVSGAVVFARTSKAAARLNRQFLLRQVAKCYWAVSDQAPHPPAGTWTDWLLRDEPSQRMRIVTPATPGAREAVLDYQVRQRKGNRVLLEIHPRTGRRHQIRVQLAAHGCPILGDPKYGNACRGPSRIALHARSVALQHPTRPEMVHAVAPPPSSWSAWRFPLE